MKNKKELIAIRRAINSDQLRLARIKVKALERSVGLTPALQEFKSELDRLEILTEIK